jgi:hypothetical protein
MKTYTFAIFAILTAFSRLSCPTVVQAQVVGVPLFVVQSNQQDAPGELTFNGYYFSERVVETNPGDIDFVSLAYPGSGGSIPYDAPTGSNTVAFDNSSYYPSVADLQTAFPFGQYTTTYSGTFSGSDTVNYAANNFPTSNPEFDLNGFDILQNFNAGSNETITFEPFTGYLTGSSESSFVFLDIYNTATGAEVFADDFLPVGTTSIQLPAGTLSAGSYEAALIFSNRVNSDDNNGVDTTVGSDYQTYTYFSTAGAPTAPSISSIYPESGPIGTSITIYGANLSGASLVTFAGGAAAAPSNVTGTSAAVVVPSGALSGPVSITTPVGTPTSPDSFTVVSTPVITGFSPGSGPTGTIVTVSGSGFTGASAASIDGVPASFTFVSDSTVDITVPAGAATGPIHLRNAAGLAVSPTNFTVVPAPTITSFIPTSGPVGTEITVTGTGFTGTLAASIDGIPAYFVVVNATTEDVTVPSGASTGPIHIKTPDGLAISGTNFTVLPAPTISSFAPTSGPVGTVIAVTGTGFTGTTAASVDSIPASFTVVSNTLEDVTVPSGASTGPVHIKTAAGLAISPTNFTVTTAMVPTITSFTPTSGPVGTVIVVTGTNFTGTTAASVDGVQATFSVVSNTVEDVTVPALATTGAVHIKTPSGLAVSATNFTVLPAPTITSFTPTSGPVGTVIVVTGTGFTGTTAASVDGFPAAFTVVNNTTEDVTVPSAASTGAVHIKTPNGLAASPTNFTVN